VVMSSRVVAGLVLCFGGVFLAGTLDVLDWAWPLSVLGLCALLFPGIAVIEPPLERRVARWRGRSTTA
jgi:hypothetical protein